MCTLCVLILSTFKTEYTIAAMQCNVFAANAFNTFCLVIIPKQHELPTHLATVKDTIKILNRRKGGTTQIMHKSGMCCSIHTSTKATPANHIAYGLAMFL